MTTTGLPSGKTSRADKILTGAFVVLVVGVLVALVVILVAALSSCTPEYPAARPTGDLSGPVCCQRDAATTCRVTPCPPCGPPPDVICDDTCVNLLANDRNCGACGIVCTAGQGCCAGTCTELDGGNCPEVDMRTR